LPGFAAAKLTGVRLNPWLCCMGGIDRMVDSVVDLDIFEFEWIDAFQAANIVAKLLRIRAALVMCVDAAD